MGYYSIEMTKCLKIGSLNLHVASYELHKNGTQEEIKQHFNDPKAVTSDCYFFDYFRGAQMIDDTVTGYILHPIIKQFCQAYGVTNPDIVGIGNAFNFPVQKYYTNYKNSVCVHAYNRIRKFFYSRTQSKKRIYDTLHYLFHRNSAKTPDQTLVNAIKSELHPIDFEGNESGYFAFMEDKWYRYVPMFMHLQR